MLRGATKGPTSADGCAASAGDGGKQALQQPVRYFKTIFLRQGTVLLRMKTATVLASLLILTLLLFGCSTQPSQTTRVVPSPAATPAPEAMVKNFTLVGDRFRFFLEGAESPTLTVNQGDTVRIVLTSNDMPHDWVVDEFSVRTPQVLKGEPAVSVEFVATKKGTFEYYCSVGQHRANGMKGTLVVQ
jgi:plastocyanin